MRERAAQILKIVCIGLAALLLVQLVKVGYRVNPLAGAAIPPVPSLPGDTNTPPMAAANKPPGKSGTNSPAAATGTNGPAVAMNTNVPATKKSKEKSTNQLSSSNSGTTNETAISSPSQPRSGGEVTLNGSNTMTAAETSVGTNSIIATNVVTKVSESNAAPVVLVSSLTTNTLGTNITIAASPTNATAAGTNALSAKLPGGTNLAASVSAKTNSTNSALAKASGAKSPPMMPPMNGGPGGKAAAKLPPEIQARIDRVVESEILAPVMHPMPMALLGIAGKVAFLRSPSGQTGLVKEGDDLGEIKLLRIGTNRVLVEQDGQKKELMIFSGLGGESLMPKTTETSDETIKH